jgi:hypothetical protein
MMGAGLGSSSLYKSNPNVNTFGGNKKQGLPISVGLDPWADRASRTFSIGMNRNKLFVMNQLGGVGVGRSMFNVNYTNKDGVRKASSEIRTDIIYISNLTYGTYGPTPAGSGFLMDSRRIPLGTPITDNSIIQFTFVVPYSCIDSSKTKIKISQLTTLYDISVVDNQHINMTYATFKQILTDSGSTQIPIIEAGLLADLYFYYSGNLDYC